MTTLFLLLVCVFIGLFISMSMLSDAINELKKYLIKNIFNKPKI